MLLKILLLAGIVAVVYYAFFNKKSLSTPKNDDSLDEAMIPCSRCGTYVQAKEALMREGKYYCSRECVEA